ncbi:MAG: hypothetical protein ACOCXA_08775 [Planctomycetota bacterium]
MKGFLRTFVFGLAMLFMLIAGLVVTLALATDGDVRRQLRDWVLSDDEQAVLRDEAERSPRPPMVRILPSEDKDRILQELADRVSSNQIRDLLAELRQRERMLAEQRSYLDQREAELRIAEADLLRMQQELQRERQRVQRLVEEREERYARFAALHERVMRQMNVMDAVRRERLADQAELFQAMGKDAWQSLRRFSAAEIAQYLALMETKKAAEIIKQANKDQEFPDLAYKIHQEWLKLDLAGLTGDRIDQLAALYTFMRADDVAPKLIAAGSISEAASIVAAMQQQGGAKKAAAVLEAMRRIDDTFERQVQEQIAAGLQEGDT